MNVVFFYYREYKEYNKIVNECRLGCKQKEYPSIVPNQDPYFKHYEVMQTLIQKNRSTEPYKLSYIKSLKNREREN